MLDSRRIGPTPDGIGHGEAQVIVPSTQVVHLKLLNGMCRPKHDYANATTGRRETYAVGDRSAPRGIGGHCKANRIAAARTSLHDFQCLDPGNERGGIRSRRRAEESGPKHRNFCWIDRTALEHRAPLRLSNAMRFSCGPAAAAGLMLPAEAAAPTAASAG